MMCGGLLCIYCWGMTEEGDMDLQTQVLAMLRSERERQGLTQLEAAIRMGNSLSVLNKIERGSKGSVKLDTLERYAAALGMRLEIRLVAGTEDSPR